MHYSVLINNNQFLFRTTSIQLTKINQNKILALKCKFSNPFCEINNVKGFNIELPIKCHIIYDIDFIM